MEGAKRKLDELGVEIVYVYTREPHAGQRMRGFDFSGENQTKSVEERLANAQRCRKKYGFTIRWVIDGMGGDIQNAYGGLPNSGFLIRSDGVVAGKQAWADASALLAEVEKLKPPSWYTAGEEEKAVLLDVYEASIKARKSRSAEARLSAIAALAGLKHQAVLPRIGACLDDQDAAVRNAAHRALLSLVHCLPSFDPSAQEEHRAAAAAAVKAFLRAAERSMRFDEKSGRFSDAWKKAAGPEGGDGAGGGKDGESPK